jgi:hypothetical protein
MSASAAGTDFPAEMPVIGFCSCIVDGFLDREFLISIFNFFIYV